MPRDNPSKDTLHLLGKSAVVLTPLEADALATFVSHRGVPLTRDTLARHLTRGGQRCPPTLVDVLVLRLRRKLDSAGLGATVLAVGGRGYALFDRLPTADATL